MKLYHHAGSWQLPGQQDKAAARVDVPSSPADLAAWLNARKVPIAGDAFDGLVPGNAAARELLEELRGDAGGAVLTTADVDQVNATRPPFLGQLSADEIERRRLAMGQCPKCSSSPATAARSWIDRASADQLRAIRNHIADRLEEMEEEASK